MTFHTNDPVVEHLIKKPNIVSEGIMGCLRGFQARAPNLITLVLSKSFKKKKFD